MALTDYSSLASTKQYWLDNIAPKYFNMSDISLYNVSTFGYINEVMATIMEDSLYASNILRREFYPASADYISSLYKMAALQDVDLPMVTPAKASVTLLIKEDDLFKNATTGLNEVIIDDSMISMVDDIQFMLDYPVKIIFNYDGTAENTKYTVHYDRTYKNSISQISDDYIMYRAGAFKNNERYLAIKVDMHQVTRTDFSELVIKNSVLESYSVDIAFDGNIANFEVFYQESDGSTEEQLTKKIDSNIILEEKFCNYTFINENTLRLTIPYNIYWTPSFNSTLTIKLYTSLGEAGNFDSYSGDVICTCDSEKYAYDNDIFIIGIVNGSSLGGCAKPDKDGFRQKIIDAYTTNNTIVTATDLQILYNSFADDYNRLIFYKKRDDCFIRLFGAYMLMRDANNNIVPTNTSNLKIPLDYSDPDNVVNIINPGELIVYDKSESDDNVIDTSNGKMQSFALASTFEEYNSVNFYSNLDGYENVDFIYTNPFLITVAKNPQVVGYYSISKNDEIPMLYDYINDKSLLQFSYSNLKIERDGFMDSNYDKTGGFYKFSITLRPSLSLELDKIFSTIQASAVDKPSTIYAEHAGYVKRFFYDKYKHYCMEVSYDNGDGTRSEKSYVLKDTDFLDIYNSDRIAVMPTDGSTYEYEYENEKVNERCSGYVDRSLYNDLSSYKKAIESHPSNEGGRNFYTTLNVGNVFYSGDVLAISNGITDNYSTLSEFKKHNIQVVGIFDEIISASDQHVYMPFTLESYDDSTDGFTFCAYLEIGNSISDINTVKVLSGLFKGSENGITDVIDCEAASGEISINISNLMMKIHVFADTNTIIGVNNGSSNSQDSNANSSKYNQLDFTYITLLKGSESNKSDNKNDNSNNDDNSDDNDSNNNTSTSDYRYTLCNSYYPNADEPFDLITPIKYIRSTLTLNDDVTNLAGTAIIKGCPVVKANWIKIESNAEYFYKKIQNIYDFITDTFYDLEQNFSIDFKFYNTYGKSRYYNVGVGSTRQALNQVNCDFSFGVKLSTIANSNDTFKEKFVQYVRDYIETINGSDYIYNSLYILNMCSDIKNNFDEIEYLEYYGMNMDYYAPNSEAQNNFIIQKIEVNDSVSEVNDGSGNFIPEFVNVSTTQKNGVSSLNVSVTFL